MNDSLRRQLLLSGKESAPIEAVTESRAQIGPSFGNILREKIGYESTFAHLPDMQVSFLVK